MHEATQEKDVWIESLVQIMRGCDGKQNFHHNLDQLIRQSDAAPLPDDDTV